MLKKKQVSFSKHNGKYHTELIDISFCVHGTFQTGNCGCKFLGGN